LKVAVLGGGLSGLACLYELQSRGVESFLLEADSKVGGLAKTAVINGYIYDLHGGHIFNSKYENVRRWVFPLLPESSWTVSKRVAKIAYEDRLISYPFELALWQLPTEDAVDCIVDLINSRKGPEPENFEEWLGWAFGKSIADKYLVPYNRKIWRYDLSKVSSHWVQGKMPFPAIREVLHSVLSQNSNESKMPHSFFYYPKSGGIQSMIDAIAAPCINLIQTGVKVKVIEKKGHNWLINGEYSATHIISTIPVNALIKTLANAPDYVCKAAADLKWNSLTTTLCSRTELTGFSWLYLPSSEYFCHRIVYQGELSAGCCPPGCSSAIYEATCSVTAEQLLDNIGKERTFPQMEYNEVLGTSYTDYAYPIYDLSFENNIGVINSWLDDSGIKRCGRFAEWRYYNMDICIKRALEEVDTLIKSSRARQAV